jgi:hypothetical protein
VELYPDTHLASELARWLNEHTGIRRRAQSKFRGDDNGEVKPLGGERGERGRRKILTEPRSQGHGEARERYGQGQEAIRRACTQAGERRLLAC